MLNKAKTLKGYKLDSLDGEIGTSKNSISMTGTGRFAIWSPTRETGLRAGRF